ncbi:MAG: glycosyl hydrolase 108 family protein [Rhodomicrobium sp.]
MASDNFERCLAITLKWEGGYSNHPDDPGGPTMKGVIQREYDAWRKKRGKRPRPVRQIEEEELRAIYRDEYWDAMECDGLTSGFDLCVFDAAVNSGVGRAQKWIAEARDIDAFCDVRLAFLQGLGRLWRVFGAGWRRRVQGIRDSAHLMAGQSVTVAPHDTSLHAGMRGKAIRELQEKLRALGYPCGAVDGIFGEQLHRAIILFQHDNSLEGEPGIWLPSYSDTLEAAEPMLPKRAAATIKDLERAGDGPTRRMNFLQRIFAWLFGASAFAQAFQGDSVLDSVSGLRTIIEPIQGVMEWLASNRWLLIAAACIGLIALVRLMRGEHVEAYQNFDYQGQATGKEDAQ